MKVAPVQPNLHVHEIRPVSDQWNLTKPFARIWRAPKLKILLVEDDEADVYLIRGALAENTRVRDVTVARDGVEALQLIDNGDARPDLAIVDLHLPRKDGFALLRDFASRDTVQFPSIVLTSSRAGADAFRAKKRGAVEFLTKPNTREKLKSVLDTVISRM